MTKKNLMPTIVLVIICLVTALLMGGVNMLTKDRINANAEAAANEALKVVLPNGKNFKKIEEFPEEYPGEITAAYKADGGYVFQAETQGNKPGVVVMCGIDDNGRIVGVEVISDAETPDYKSMIFPLVTGAGGKYNGKDIDSLSPEIASGATKSSRAVYEAVKASLNAYAVATGGEVVEKPDKEPEEVIDTTTPVTSRTDEEVYNLAKALYDKDVELEGVYVYNPYVTTRKVYKNAEDNTYVFYVATRTQDTPLETEALVMTDSKGTVLKIDLLTWTVGHGVDYTPEYLNSFIGINRYFTDDVELVSGATGTSDHLVEALKLAFSKVFGSVAITDSEIEKRADKSAPLGDDAIRMPLPENAPETVKAMFKLKSGRGYMFYVSTKTQRAPIETEAFVFVDINGKIMNVDVVSWIVGHQVYVNEAIEKSFNGLTYEDLDRVKPEDMSDAENLEKVELVSGATGSSVNLSYAIGDALTLVPEHTNYSLIAGIILAAAALLMAGAAVYFKVIKRRREQ